jgi:dolichyl-phosphate-mannose-protein mannosyltransferase
VSQNIAEPKHRISPTLPLLALTLLAAGLRFWRLGNWSLDSDEVWMLRDSLDPSLSNPRPLLYFMNHYLVQPFMPLDELGLRVLPAIFGVLAIPVFYYICRRMAGTRAALFGALLVATSPLLIYYSQFGRYWSLVFLLATVYPYAIYLGIRERNRGWLALGIVTAVLAVLAHPTSVLLLGGLGIWMAAIHVRRGRLAELWRRRRLSWPVVLIAILVGAGAVRSIALLHGWISSHDRRPGATTFLLHIPSTPGVQQLSFFLGFIESLTTPLVLTGVLGTWLLLQGRDRSLGALLTLIFLFPLAFLELLSFRTAISTFYLLPTVPVLFIGAGVFLDRLAAIQWELRPAWLVSAGIAGMILAAGAPTVVSQYRDGRRWDFRGVARWLDGRLSPEDVVFSDQSHAMAHYLPGTPVQRLRGDPTLLIQSQRTLNQSGRGGTLWIVAPAPSHAFRTNPELGKLNQWLYDNCQLRNTIGRGRVDFRQQYLQIYHCPPAAPEGVSRRPTESSDPSETKASRSQSRSGAL